MKSLIIVESPTKAKTISRFLGAGYRVASSFGHVRDLPEKRFGIVVADHFEPEYIIAPKAKPIIKKLKEGVRAADEIILATDEDREGEAIAWHLAEALGLNKKSKKQLQRIAFHEITQSAIEAALRRPRSINMDLVNAQQARRILDRLVGYKLSPFLWQKVAKGLSAGRVQSVAVRLIVERENEIRNFKTEEYWTIIALLLKTEIKNQELGIKGIIEAGLTKINDKLIEKFDIKTKDEAEKIVADLERCAYRVLNIERKETKRYPPPPFTTSTLQQEAVKRLGFSSKKTMFLAQQLYENGLITYMRTDSVNLSEESLRAAKDWLEKNLGERYAAQAPRRFSTKSKLAQEAHEAVRPTNPGFLPEAFAGDPGQKKLYELIWRRFIASQMPPAAISTTVVEIAAGSQQPEINSRNEYTLKATGQEIVFDGYLKIWPQKISEYELPPLAEKEALTLRQVNPEQHFTEPPPRYSEATLIKTLEENGIGRPSTYAPIISVIQTRNYVVKEAGRFQPTTMGELVNKVLTENFPEVVDINFTARLEDGLDAVAEGKEQWQDLLGAFYGPFIKNLNEKYATVVRRQPMAVAATGETCPQCDKPLVTRMSRYGPFVACSGFPECRFVKKIKKELVSTGVKCPKCGQGELVERLARRGRQRRFWGCTRYPECDYTTGENPSEKIPKIGN